MTLYKDEYFRRVKFFLQKIIFTQNGTTIYMASAMLWEETAMAWTGAWILAVTALATIVGTPAAWWVMAVLGGGGLLAVGLVQLAMRKAVR